VKEFPSGQIVFGNYYKKIGEIASLTKIMTFCTVCDIGEKYNKNLSTETIEIDEEAQSMGGTSAEIFVGDTYTVEQLLYGLMLPSGNDAATALAKWGGGVLEGEMDSDPKSKTKNSEVRTFVRHMNVVAQRCGMKNSKFCNAHGLPHPESFSNAEDLSCLLVECLKL
jgi:D-alanyl-D-alanine carboxypeptidase (penicillin-binding protein 5/6)